MALEIVWRNPVLPRKTHSQVELIVLDESGALYAVICADRKLTFEVIPGKAA
jgi:hypothetical protein